MLFGACHKDDNGRVELILEPLGSTGTKLAIDSDINATWTTGDVINFNGAPVSITREDNNHAYISNTYAQEVNSACFPASLHEGSLSGNNITFTLPEHYHYRRDTSNNQLLELPMVARNDNGKPLRFRHLTAALCFIISNDRTDGKTLVIDSLTVSSTAYRLCGEYRVNMNDVASLAPQPIGSGVSQVTIFFDRERLELAPGTSRKVMIPVMPVGDSNQFTVTVSSRCNGTRYNYTKTQSQGGALPRNMLAYASMSLNNSPAATGNLFEGNGASNNPFKIQYPTDLIAFAEACNGDWKLYTAVNYSYSSYCFAISNNLDMEGISINPITNFSGTKFNGNNKRIENLTIVGTSEFCGLFTEVEGKTLENITLNNITLQSSVSITSKPLYIGSLAGQLKATTVNNCDVDGLNVMISNASAGVYFGGITGNSVGAINLSNCDISYSQSASINTNQLCFGGIVGFCDASSGVAPTITRCTVTTTGLSFSTSNGIVYAGGIIGYSQFGNSTLNYCSWSGTLSLDSGSGNLYAGGLAGCVLKGSSGKLLPSNCIVGGAGSSISATSTGTTKRLGAYIGSNNGTIPDFAGNGCTKNVTLTLNGNTVTSDIGN